MLLLPGRLTSRCHFGSRYSGGSRSTSRRLRIRQRIYSSRTCVFACLLPCIWPTNCCAANRRSSAYTYIYLCSESCHVDLTGGDHHSGRNIMSVCTNQNRALWNICVYFFIHLVFQVPLLFHPPPPLPPLPHLLSLRPWTETIQKKSAWQKSDKSEKQKKDKIGRKDNRGEKQIPDEIGSMPASR